MDGHMDRHIANFRALASGSIYSLVELDRTKRREYHEYIDEHCPDLILRSEYKEDRSIKYVKCACSEGCNICGNCNCWTKVKDPRNACCGDDAQGCTSTMCYVTCHHCTGSVRFDLVGANFRYGWRSTGNMILLTKGTAYKNMKPGVSYRKWRG